MRKISGKLLLASIIAAALIATVVVFSQPEPQMYARLAYYDLRLIGSPHNADYYLAKAGIMYSLERYEDCIRNCAVVLKYDSNKGESVYQAICYMGSSLIKLEDWETGLKMFARLAKGSPKASSYHFFVGMFMKGLNRPQEAALSFNEAIELDPKNSEALSELGLILSKIKKYELALQLFGRALEIEPGNPLTWRRQGNAFLYSGRTAEALACFDKALAINPRYGDAILSRGIAFTFQGKYELALKEYNKVLKMYPDFKEAWLAKGSCCALAGDLDGAEKALDRALRLEPTSLRLRHLRDSVRNKDVKLDKKDLLKMLDLIA